VSARPLAETICSTALSVVTHAFRLGGGQERLADRDASAARGARVGSPAVSGYRSALRHRDLRLLFGGLVISATGSWAYNVALLAYVYDRTHSLGWVGAAGLGRFLPALAFSAYGGVVAERFERVRVMVTSDLLCLAFQAGMAIVAASQGPVALVIALAAMTSVANIVYNPAVAAMIPQVAGEDDLAAANALNSTIENLTVITGPAVGAGLLALGEPSTVFAINAASFGASALVVSRMRARSRPVDVTEEGEAGPFQQMLVGLRTIIELPAARVPVALCALVSFVYGTDTVLFIAVSDERLGTGPEGFGYLLAGLGVGGVLMAAAVDRLAASRRLALVITAGVLVYCLPTALLTVVHSPAVAFALQIVRGAGTLVVDVLAVIALQRAVAPERVARVFGVFFAIVLGAISLGTLITPPLVRALGLEGGLLTMALVPSLLGLLGYPALAALDRAAADRMAELAPRIDVLQRLGIFAAAPQAVLERLAAAAREATFPSGTAVVREGDPADALYVLLDGEVRVTARGEAGEREEALRSMGPGTYFGEIGLLEGIPRTATVTAVEDCRCYRIDGDAFLDALTATPPATSLLEGARTRLARTHPSRRPTFTPEETQPAQAR
jgi:predicted MFS family arabinose efflux permease